MSWINNEQDASWRERLPEFVLKTEASRNHSLFSPAEEANPTENNRQESLTDKFIRRSVGFNRK